ncbi:hypothetical protein HDU98_002451 [Podochytrium sp. JEL0797]|nr:hypothetical protein HDU98_002451 [Podochytrium sp. JEL0797]
MSVLTQGSNNGLYEACSSPANSAAGASPASCPAVYGDYLDAFPGSCDTCGLCNVFSGQWTYYSLRGALGQQPSAPLAAGPTGTVNNWSYEYFKFSASATAFTPQYRNYTNYFIAFDDVASIRAKTSWAKGNGLGGQIMWELTSDFEQELVAAAVQGWN